MGMLWNQFSNASWFKIQILFCRKNIIIVANWPNSRIPKWKSLPDRSKLKFRQFSNLVLLFFIRVWSFVTRIGMKIRKSEWSQLFNPACCIFPCKGWPISPSSRLRNKDGWWGLARRLFGMKSIMGRLCEDHFGHLGYLPKFDGVQDARYTVNSSNG